MCHGQRFPDLDRDGDLSGSVAQCWPRSSRALEVYPNEMKDVLSTQRKARLAIISMPVGRPDQRAKAFVVLRQARMPTSTKILGFLRARLPPYQVRRSSSVPKLPLAFTGKVRRRKVAVRGGCGGGCPA
jgi:acyl-CoA synthetase (AMP-forming)/AMP-acid ligase II